MIRQSFCHRRCSLHPFLPSLINSLPKWLMRLDKVVPSLEKVQGMSVPPQDLAAIHALAHKSSQWIANCEIQALDIGGIDLSTRINTEQLLYLNRITIDNALYYLNESSVLSFLANLCVLQVWVRNQYRIRLSSDSAVRRRLKKTINIEKSFLERIPVIWSKYRNRRINCATSFDIAK